MSRPSGARRLAIAWRYDVPLGVGLVVLWCLLWGSWAPLTIACGVLVALLTTQLLPLPPVPLSARFSPWHVLVFLAVWGAQVVVASFQVAWIAVRRRPVRRNALVFVQLRSSSEMTFTLAAIAITLVPGSYVVDVDVRRRRLLLHVLDTDDAGHVERMRAQAIGLEARVISAIGSRHDVDALRTARGSGSLGGGAS